MSEGRHFGIVSVRGGTAPFVSIIIQGFDQTSNVDKAIAKNEDGKTINVKAYSKATSITCQGLLNADEPDVEAGAVVVVKGMTCLVDSSQITESNTDFVHYNLTLSSEDGCVPEAYS